MFHPLRNHQLYIYKDVIKIKVQRMIKLMNEKIKRFDSLLRTQSYDLTNRPVIHFSYLPSVVDDVYSENREISFQLLTSIS